MILFDNPFSPFTRKVRMVLHYKGIRYESVDGLALDKLPELREKNPRGEVPVLIDGETVVVDSQDIVDYLEDAWPDPTVYPTTPRERARVRYWQRFADRTIDAILHDISLWGWPTHERSDTPPDGLLEAGRGDLRVILAELEGQLANREFVCGDLSIADFALFPHFPGMRLLGVPLDPKHHPNTRRWERTMRGLPVVREDLRRVRKALEEGGGEGGSPYESNLVVWRGDRIEWLLGKGFDDWWSLERASGRAVVPDVIVGRGLDPSPP